VVFLSPLSVVTLGRLAAHFFSFSDDEFYVTFPHKLPKIIFADYDGTLRPATGPTALIDRLTFKRLGQAGVVRVVATGRSLYSFSRDCPADLELDYLIYTSGLGLCRWGPQGPGEHLAGRSLSADQAARAVVAAVRLQRGFFAFEPPPRTHWFRHQEPVGRPPTEGHLSRVAAYADFAAPFEDLASLGPLGTLLITAPKEEMPPVRAAFEREVPDLSTLYASSPFGDPCLWLEIFPPGVSKAQAAQALAADLGLGPQDALAAGNDYNDLDLLAWAGAAFLAADAPPELRTRFPLMPASTDAPLSRLLAEALSRA
jgi:hydroxymethylpyrimidine pyrophosphatase-like HAD family hydrolase